MMSLVDKPLSPRSPKVAGASRPDDKSVSVGESPGRQRTWATPAMIESRKIVEQVRTVGIFPPGVDAVIAGYAAAGGPGAGALDAALCCLHDAVTPKNAWVAESEITAHESGFEVHARRVRDVLRQIKKALDGPSDESSREVAALGANLKWLRHELPSRLPIAPYLDRMIDVIIHAAGRRVPGLQDLPKHDWPECVIHICSHVLEFGFVDREPELADVLRGLRAAAKKPEVADLPWLDRVSAREAAMSAFLEQHASEVLSLNLLLTSADLSYIGDGLDCVFENWRVPGCAEAMTLRALWQLRVGGEDPDDEEEPDKIEDPVTQALKAIASVIMRNPPAAEEDAKASAKRPEMRDLRRSIIDLQGAMRRRVARPFDDSDSDSDDEQGQPEFIVIQKAVRALDSGSCLELLPVVEAGKRHPQDGYLDALDEGWPVVAGPARPESKRADPRDPADDEPVDDEVPVDDQVPFDEPEMESSEPPAKKARVGNPPGST